MSSARILPIPAGLLILSMLGCEAGANVTSDPPTPLHVQLEAAGTLERGMGPILASARTISRSSNGLMFLADDSDLQVKVFGSDGVQADPLGAPGPGPGEFTTLFSAGLLGDTVYAWDMAANRLSFFDAAGRFARSVPLQRAGGPSWNFIRALDDSLLVASGWVMGAHDRPLVGVFDRNGTVVEELVEMEALFSPPDPVLLQNTMVYADGMDGVVFATLHGIDTIVAHDLDGERLGAGRVELEATEPVLDLRRVIRESGGDLQRPDGTWAHDGQYAALNLIALARNVVAVQYGLLDLVDGTDLMASGGPIAVLRLDPDGAIRRIAQLEAPGALLGRSDPDTALVLHWSGGELEQLELHRLVVGEEAER